MATDLDPQLDGWARNVNLVKFLVAHGWTVASRDAHYTEMRRAGVGHAVNVGRLDNGLWGWTTRKNGSGRIWHYLQRYEGGDSLGHVRAYLRRFLEANTAVLGDDDVPAPVRVRARITLDVIAALNDRPNGAAPASAEDGALRLRLRVRAKRTNRATPRDYEAVRRRWATMPSGAPYLLTRGLDPDLIARFPNEIRTDSHGYACCAHRLAGGQLVGYEFKGPRPAGEETAKRSKTGFAKNGSKALFRVGVGEFRRIVICESAIDALSVAQYEGLRDGTRYASVYGSMGDDNIATLREIARRYPGLLWSCGFDADARGAEFTEQVRAIVVNEDPSAMIEDVGLPEAPDPAHPFKDWNEVICEAEYLGRLERERLTATADEVVPV